jgi:hypothetical protein
MQLKKQCIEYGSGNKLKGHEHHDEQMKADWNIEQRTE